MLAPTQLIDAMPVEDAKRLELPKGWASITLGEVCLPVKKVSPTQRPDELFTYLDIASIDNAQLRIVSPKTYLGKDAPSRARQRVKAGSVLFSTVRTYLKNIAMVPAKLDGQIASTGFCVLSPSDQMNAGVVFYFVQHDEFVEKVNPIQRGTSYPAVRDSDVLAQPFPLPPLAEQHRIVAEIEKQFTRLDASVAALKRVQANLKRYRASVLKEACEGKLVPTEAALARAEGRDYEPAGQLLERILAERRARWESQEKRRGKYKEPSPPDISDLPELPRGWVWATVEQMVALEANAITDGPFGSKLKTSHYTDDGPRVIRLQNIGDGTFIDAYAHISWEHYATLVKHKVEAGDLVIAALGGTLPRACVIPSTVGPAIVKADCIRYKPAETVALAAFLNYALNNEETRRRTASIVHGVGRPRLNLKEIKATALPLPPRAEQHRIVAEVERRLSVIQQVESTVESNLVSAERLRQSILKQAFSGKLVPQDPNDEPASELLERIRAEREAAGVAAKPKSRAKRRRAKSSPERQRVLVVQEKTL